MGNIASLQEVTYWKAWKPILKPTFSYVFTMCSLINPGFVSSTDVNLNAADWWRTSSKVSAPYTPLQVQPLRAGWSGVVRNPSAPGVERRHVRLLCYHMIAGMCSMHGGDVRQTVYLPLVSVLVTVWTRGIHHCLLTSLNRHSRPARRKAHGVRYISQI